MKKKSMKKQKNNSGIDYYTLFNMGIIFTGTGVVFLTTLSNGVGTGMMGLGIVYMIIGAKHKDEWKIKKKKK